MYGLREGRGSEDRQIGGIHHCLLHVARYVAFSASLFPVTATPMLAVLEVCGRTRKAKWDDLSAAGRGMPLKLYPTPPSQRSSVPVATPVSMGEQHHEKANADYDNHDCEDY